MRAIDDTRYGAAARGLIEDARAGGLPRTLAFSAPVAAARAALAALTDAELGSGKQPADASAAALLRAGLWLLYDYMDESHGICQEIETTEGSYWHGLVHRREPDAGNARYWFARVGRHAIFGELHADAREIVAATPAAAKALGPLVDAPELDSARLVNLCTSSPLPPPVEKVLLAIQRREWELLYDFCFARAFGG